MQTHQALSWLWMLLALWLAACTSTADETSKPPSDVITFEHDEASAQVHVRLDGQPFTSYLYHDSLEKPVLWPILTSSGKAVTRGFPFAPRPFERTDHPHHVGHWMNYGDVNGLDFWNNSYRVSEDRKPRFGWIHHREILEMETRGELGLLKVRMSWTDHEEEPLLEEVSTFTFSRQGGVAIIEREATLTALGQRVAFTDNKEGFFAIRMTRELEHPTEGELRLTDAAGNPQEEKVAPPPGLSGQYLSSEGLTGEAVWGTRAAWVRLSGELEGSTVSVAILDHPRNPGYPTYWHARPYGLFSANPLGQNVFSKGAEELNFALEPGASTTFRYRILVHEGAEPLGTDRIASLANF